MDNIFLQIITPTDVFYDGEVSFVEYNTTEGYVGIFPKHVPMTQVIEPGKLVIYESNGDRKIAALHAGFVKIMPDVITILAEIIEWRDDIDLDRAMKAKSRAEENLRENRQDADLVKTELALKRAIARIKVVG